MPIRVRRAVVHVGGTFKPTTPKSQAGVRDVAIPPHLLPAVREHLVEHVEPGLDALLFTAEHGGHLARSTLPIRALQPCRGVAVPACR